MRADPVKIDAAAPTGNQVRHVEVVVRLEVDAFRAVSDDRVDSRIGQNRNLIYVRVRPSGSARYDCSITEEPFVAQVDGLLHADRADDLLDVHFPIINRQVEVIHECIRLDYDTEAGTIGSVSFGFRLMSPVVTPILRIWHVVPVTKSLFTVPVPPAPVWNNSLRLGAWMSRETAFHGCGRRELHPRWRRPSR